MNSKLRSHVFDSFFEGSQLVETFKVIGVEINYTLYGTDLAMCKIFSRKLFEPNTNSALFIFIVFISMRQQLYLHNIFNSGFVFSHIMNYAQIWNCCAPGSLLQFPKIL